MADVATIIAVTGENVVLLLNGTEPITGPVEVDFQWRTEGPDPIITLDFWTENLTAEAADPATDGGAVARIKWKVNLNGSFAMPRKPPMSLVSFSIASKTPSGKPLRVTAGNRLRIPAFSVTQVAKARRIMRHEFFREVSFARHEFNETPVLEAMDKLDPAQRKLLANHDPGPTGNRLVALITLQKENNTRMHADTCPRDFGGPPDSVKPNSDFMLFHVQGPGKPVTLVCFTRFFVVNMKNGPTFDLMRNPLGGKVADDWLARSNPKPPGFKIGAFVLPNVTDGVFWNQIYTKNGTLVMPGNTLHGGINTVGCWMLFRNYNWPQKNDKGEPIEDKLDRIYCKIMRPRKAPLEDLLKALAEVGYDDETSFDKFAAFDRNHAYHMFFRDIVGIKYFSRTSVGWDAANDVFSHQQFFSKFNDPAAIQEFIDTTGDGGNIYHDIEERIKKDPGFKVDNSFIVENCLGFKTFSNLNNALKAGIPKAEALERTWCDLYLYRADDLKAKDFKPVFLADIS